MSIPFGGSPGGHCLDTMLDALFRGTFCPVLGAGASCDVGVPGGKGLVERLAQALGLDVTAARRTREDHGPLGALDLMRLQAPTDEEFFRALQEVLYAPVPRDWTRRSGFPRSALFHVAELVSILAVRWGPRDFHALTYNFDTLLEEALAALGYAATCVVPGEELEFRPASSSERFGWPAMRERGRGRKDATIRVVHPHGVVPRREREGMERAQARMSHLVVDASSLAHHQTIPLHLRSRWQIRAFGSRNCLFYGLSFDDPAVRMLLEDSRQPGSSAESSMKHVALVSDPPQGSVRGWRAAWERALRNRRIVRLRSVGFEQQKRFLRILASEALVTGRRAWA